MGSFCSCKCKLFNSLLLYFSVLFPAYCPHTLYNVYIELSSYSLKKKEYKRRSGGSLLGTRDVIEAGTSPPAQTVLLQSYDESSGSLSSSVSLSDRSASTDCLEEFIGDAPFAGT